MVKRVFYMILCLLVSACSYYKQLFPRNVLFPKNRNKYKYSFKIEEV